MSYPDYSQGSQAFPPAETTDPADPEAEPTEGDDEPTEGDDSADGPTETEAAIAEHKERESEAASDARSDAADVDFPLTQGGAGPGAEPRDVTDVNLP